MEPLELSPCLCRTLDSPAVVLNVVDCYDWFEAVCVKTEVTFGNQFVECSVAMMYELKVFCTSHQLQKTI